MSQTNLILIMWVNEEKQLLRIFCSLYFKTKCNNKKDSFEFFYQELFLPLKYAK